MRRHLEESKMSISPHKESITDSQPESSRGQAVQPVEEYKPSNNFLAPFNNFSPPHTVSRPSIQGDSSDSAMSPAASTFGIKSDTVYSKKSSKKDKTVGPSESPEKILKSFNHEDAKEETKSKSISNFSPVDVRTDKSVKAENLTPLMDRTNLPNACQ